MEPSALPSPESPRALTIISNRPLIVSAFVLTAEAEGLPAAVLDFQDAAGAVRSDDGWVLIDVCGDPAAAVRACLALSGTTTTPVVLLVTRDRSVAVGDLAALMRCRPAGVLGAETTPEDLIIALRLIAKGKVVFELDRSADARMLLERSLWPGAGPAGAPELEPEEQELLSMIAAGLGDEEIAVKLYLSEATVRRRVALLRRKTATGKRVELAAWGGAHGYYQPEPVRPSAAMAAESGTDPPGRGAGP